MCKKRDARFKVHAYAYLDIGMEDADHLLCSTCMAKFVDGTAYYSYYITRLALPQDSDTKQRLAWLEERVNSLCWDRAVRKQHERS